MVLWVSMGIRTLLSKGLRTSGRMVSRSNRFPYPSTFWNSCSSSWFTSLWSKTERTTGRYAFAFIGATCTVLSIEFSIVVSKIQIQSKIAWNIRSNPMSTRRLARSKPFRSTIRVSLPEPTHEFWNSTHARKSSNICCTTKVRKPLQSTDPFKYTLKLRSDTSSGLGTETTLPIIPNIDGTTVRSNDQNQ